jgi:hypothetical protein
LFWCGKQKELNICPSSAFLPPHKTPAPFHSNVGALSDQWAQHHVVGSREKEKQEDERFKILSCLPGENCTDRKYSASIMSQIASEVHKMTYFTEKNLQKKINNTLCTDVSLLTEGQLSHPQHLLGPSHFERAPIRRKHSYCDSCYQE